MGLYKGYCKGSIRVLYFRGLNIYSGPYSRCFRHVGVQGLGVRRLEV